MKKTFTLTLLLLFVSYAQLNAQAFATAGDYLDYLNTQGNTVTKDMWDYTSSIARSKGARKIENRRQEVLAQLKTAKKNVESRPSFNNQDDIKIAFVNYLRLNYDILNDDYEKIVNLEEIAENSYSEMEAYMTLQDQVNQKMAETNDQLDLAVDAFATSNSITLIKGETKLSEKMKRASLAFDYRKPLYLIFFKAYIEESKFLNALNKKDMAAAEQAKNAMVEAANEGLTALKEIKAYNGDGSLKLACMDMLKFYLKEGTTDFPAMLDFYAKQDTFIKIDAAIKSKKKSEITKAESDEFNKAVNEYNAAVNKNNTINKTLNTERSKNLDAWQKASEAFLQKHAA
jgi:hypothetical protein